MPKRGQKSREKNPLSPRMRKHLGRLGVRGLSEYKTWCKAHRFSGSTEKSAYELETELEAHAYDQHRAQRQTRLHANPRKLIERACAGLIDTKRVTRPQLRGFVESINNSPSDTASREALCKLLLKVHAEADFLLDGTSFGGRSFSYIDALTKLNERRWQWVAPLEDWRPNSHNGRRQFSSLVRHLFARYPVPAFMDQAWFQTGHGSETHREWFILLGRGENIRTADLPVPFSKRMAHHFLLAPDDYSIAGAIRWAQVHALGGGSRLTAALLGTRLAHDFSDDDFWVSVIRFFVANPLLDRRHVGPIIDYLWAQKFETREVLVGPGQVEMRYPPQPGLTMRGRTAQALLAQVERWHRELGRTSGAENLYFRRSGVKELSVKSGRHGEKVWRIRELLSGAELIAEGRAMQHCVASYAYTCAEGRSSIWAMEFVDKQVVEKRQTIEVTSDRVIVQCRGKHNRLPTTAEFDVVKEWARSAGLMLSPYVRASG